MPAAGRGKSGTGSSFCVGWHTAGRGCYCRFSYIMSGEWALGYHFLGFRHFPNIF